MAVRRSPGTKPPTAKEVALAAGARVEQMQSDIKVILDEVTGIRRELTGEIRAVRTELSAKVDDLRDVVRTNSADIRQNSADIRALRAEVRDFRHDFDHREERGRVTALEERVSAIETQLSTASR